MSCKHTHRAYYMYITSKNACGEWIECVECHEILEKNEPLIGPSWTDEEIRVKMKVRKKKRSK